MLRFAGDPERQMDTIARRRSELAGRQRLLARFARRQAQPELVSKMRQARGASEQLMSGHPDHPEADIVAAVSRCVIDPARRANGPQILVPGGTANYSKSADIRG